MCVKSGSPTRRCVAIAPPRNPVIRIAPAKEVRGMEIDDEAGQLDQSDGQSETRRIAEGNE
jgi:hypothetical protein